MVPAGFLVLYFGTFDPLDNTGAHGIRWSFMELKKQMVDTALMGTSLLLEAYPDLKGTPYSDWATSLKDYFSSAVV